MAKYIDWYLVELEKKMAAGHSQLAIHEAVVEVREHLESLAAEFVALGMPGDAAERAAVERFGGVEGMVAAPIEPRRKSKIAKDDADWNPPTLFLVLGYLLIGVGMGLPLPAMALGFCLGGLLTLVVASFACLRPGKLPVLRFAVMHLVGALLLATIASSMIIGSKGQYLRRMDLPEALQRADARTAELKEEEQTFTDALKAYRSNLRSKVEADARLFTAKVPAQESRYNGYGQAPGYLLPGYFLYREPFFDAYSSYQGRFVLGGGRTDSYLEARRFWLDSGADALARIREAREVHSNWLVSLKQSRARTYEAFDIVVAFFLAFLAPWYVAAFCLNGIANAFSRVARRRSLRPSIAG